MGQTVSNFPPTVSNWDYVTCSKQTISIQLVLMLKFRKTNQLKWIRIGIGPTEAVPQDQNRTTEKKMDAQIIITITPSPMTEFDH